MEHVYGGWQVGRCVLDELNSPSVASAAARSSASLQEHVPPTSAFPVLLAKTVGCSRKVSRPLAALDNY